MGLRLLEKLRLLFRPEERSKRGGSLFEEDLNETRLQLSAALSQFDILTDPGRIDACCYQIKALSTRYDCLIREAKGEKISRPPFSASFQEGTKGV